MPLHASTFEYHNPSDQQKERMATVREAFGLCADVVQRAVPDGPDKTHALRQLRTAAMWANVAITRDADGRPRD